MEWLESGDTLINNKKKGGKERVGQNFESHTQL